MEKGINKPADVLRAEAAEYIENNSQNYERAIEAISWLQERHPNEAKSLICLGGKMEEPKILPGVTRYNKSELNYIYIPC